MYFTKANLRDEVDVIRMLDGIKPDVVVNLAGENSPDVVEKDPASHRFLNEYLPAIIGKWCDEVGAHLVQASTQAVYGGEDPSYPAVMPDQLIEQPVNEYGRQKLNGERHLTRLCRNWTIARLTFVIGSRPLPKVGRTNPFETMYRQLTVLEPQQQVDDRWFSVCFARDAATVLWDLVGRCKIKPNLHGAVFNVGVPQRVSRYDLARSMNVWGNMSSYPTPPIHPVSHESFPGLAQRPRDTTYSPGALFQTNLDLGISEAIQEHDKMQHDRATELAMFFGCGIEHAQTRLGLGFGPNHQAVAASWRQSNPQTDEEILEWYRTTDAYCWELSAYHAEVVPAGQPDFNYRGMCRGISTHLKNEGVLRPLALGDGIGDLTLSFIEHGMDGVYHDLLGSKTAEFAAFRFARRAVSPIMLLTETFNPPNDVLAVDAVVALDFFEHLPNVESWARSVFNMLHHGGWFLAQNAFGIGDDEHEGSIPMHLVVNNQFVTGWTPLLERIGFVDQKNGWWRKP